VGRRLDRYKDNINKRPIALAVSANRSYYGFITIDYNASQGRYIRREAHSVKVYIL
jgi:hypothetical protein